MANLHETVDALQGDMPRSFTVLAWLLPPAIFGQFLSAGLGLFHNPDLLGIHAGLGFSLSLPIFALLSAAIVIRRLRSLGGWAGAILLLYLIQLGLAAGRTSLPMSLHPANGALLLTASLALLVRVERRRRPRLA